MDQNVFVSVLILAACFLFIPMILGYAISKTVAYFLYRKFDKFTPQPPQCDTIKLQHNWSYFNVGGISFQCCSVCGKLPYNDGIVDLRYIERKLEQNGKDSEEN